MKGQVVVSSGSWVNILGGIKNDKDEKLVTIQCGDQTIFMDKCAVGLFTYYRCDVNCVFQDLGIKLIVLAF